MPRPSLDEIFKGSDNRPSLDEIFSGPPKPEGEEFSPLDSGLRGGVQSLTMGLSDEGYGVGKTAGEVLSGDVPFKLDSLLEAYRKHRDVERGRNRAAQEANPKSYLAGNVVGGVLPMAVTMGGSAPATVGAAAMQGAKLGALSGFGASDAEDLGSMALDTAKGAGIGGALGGATASAQKAVPAIKKYLGDVSDEFTINATGMNAKEAANIAPGTAKYLRESGVVKPFYSAKNVADASGKKLSEVGDEMGAVMSELEGRGVTASLDDISQIANSRAKEMSARGGGYVPAAKRIPGYLEDVTESIQSSGVDPNNIPVSVINSQKRSYGQVNWADPEKAVAQKEMYRSLMDVENNKAATYKDLADRYAAAKKAHGMLDQVVDASERKSMQQQQSPMGGLMDAASMGIGAMSGGPAAAVPSAIMRRLVAPRISSTLAHVSDKMGQALPNAVNSNAIRAGQEGIRFTTIENSLNQKKQDTYVNEQEAAQRFTSPNR